jgi:hypothetical protein
VPRSHPSLLVNEELARAVGCEAAAAVCFWWGVSAGVVWRWRKALGVGRIDSPGEGPGPGAKDLARQLLPGFNSFNVRGWTGEEDDLVSTLPAAEAARRTGRTLAAVYDRRSLLGVPDGRRRGCAPLERGRRGW